MPTGKATRSATKKAPAAPSARSSNSTTNGTSKKSTKREKQSPKVESGTVADVEMRPDDENSESDFWVKRPNGG